MRPVQAAGGVLYRYGSTETEVLLIFRRGVWDLPKGKKEDNETFEECAVREVSEEVGAEKIVLEDHLLDTYHEYEQSDIQYGKTTKWYKMVLRDRNQQLLPQKEEGIKKLLWCPVGEAKQRVGFENLVRVIDAFEQNHADRKSS